jgi:hypothetical protein
MVQNSPLTELRTVMRAVMSTVTSTVMSTVMSTVTSTVLNESLKEFAKTVLRFTPRSRMGTHCLRSGRKFHQEWSRTARWTVLRTVMSTVISIVTSTVMRTVMRTVITELSTEFAKAGSGYGDENSVHADRCMVPGSFPTHTMPKSVTTLCCATLFQRWRDRHKLLADLEACQTRL